MFTGYNPKQLFGVGSGQVLASRKIGRIGKAVAELQKLVEAGANSHYLQILRVRRCVYCGGKKVSDHELGEFSYTEMCSSCSGFGFVVDGGPTLVSNRKHNYNAWAELEEKGRL